MDHCIELLELPENPQLFCFGELSISKQADATLRTSEVLAALNRHIRGDWGEASEQECEKNDESVGFGGAIISLYRSSANVEFCLLTSSLRLETTVFLREEYVVQLDR